MRYSATSSTVVRVAASIATHITPRLLVVSTTSMASVNSWYMLWYRRRPPGETLPLSRSTRM